MGGSPRVSGGPQSDRCGWMEAKERERERHVRCGQRHSKNQAQNRLDHSCIAGQNCIYRSPSRAKKINSSIGAWVGMGRVAVVTLSVAVIRAGLLFSLSSEWQDGGGLGGSVKALTLAGVTSLSWDTLSPGQALATSLQWQFYFVSCHFEGKHATELHGK